MDSPSGYTVSRAWPVGKSTRLAVRCWWAEITFGSFLIFRASRAANRDNGGLLISPSIRRSCAPDPVYMPKRKSKAATPRRRSRKAVPSRRTRSILARLIAPLWVLLVVVLAGAFVRSDAGADWASRTLASLSTEFQHDLASVTRGVASGLPVSGVAGIPTATSPTPRPRARVAVAAPVAASGPAPRPRATPLPKPQPSPPQAASASGSAGQAQPKPQRIILGSSGFPTSFDAAKRMLARDVYFDVRTDRYCGCTFDSRLRINLSTCPMRTAQFQNRQGGIEWEHVVPASDFGRQRACWRNAPKGTGGRAHCGRVDETYRLMEADPHNLIPVIGALNAIRSNYRFGMVSAGTEDPIVSGCGFLVARDGGGRFIEPPDAVKGQVARIYMYFEDRYGHRIGRSQRRVFDAWNRQFPPDAFEVERDQRLAAITGVSNPFVVLY